MLPRHHVGATRGIALPSARLSRRVISPNDFVDLEPPQQLEASWPKFKFIHSLESEWLGAKPGIPTVSLAHTPLIHSFFFCAQMNMRI